MKLKLKIKNVPNILTVIRILIIPVLFFSIYFDGKSSGIFSAILFLFASLTDFFDGYIARRFKVQSSFGKLFDPIADKMIVITAIIVLIATRKIDGIFFLFAAVIIICREIFISGAREYLAKSGNSIDVNGCGKLKTAIQMISIIFLILGGNKIQALLFLGNILFCFAALLTAISSLEYFKKIKIFYLNNK